MKDQTTEYDRRYLEGICYFKNGEFFEAHDAWEELWTEYQGPSRKFYQGLIQMAVCLHHFGNGNVRGARKLYHSCSNYLKLYPEHHEGIHLHKVLSELDVCCAELLACEDEFPNIELNTDLLPDIRLAPSEDG